MSIIIGIIALIIIIILFLSYKTKKEAYSPDDSNTDNYLYQEQRLLGPYSGKYNKENCYNMNLQQCLDCANCGICVTDGVKKCVPGDYQGPYFKTGCDKWIYTDYYDGYIFDEKKTVVVDPFDKIYPDYEVGKYPAPVSIAGL